MNNVVILPIIIPLIMGMMMALFRKNISFQRVASLIAIVATMGVAILLMYQIKNQGIQTLQLGGWEAPFGISLVADMFAILLILAASIVAFACLFYSFQSIRKEREEHYYYPMFLFLMAGVNGSFLTGDLFNLFVCFEVMLISSYVLISLGGTKIQLRESIKYVLVNLLSSSLFLVAVAYTYAVIGTLNLAHISVRVAESGQDSLTTVVALLFLIVFGLKAALFLFFWLPGAYSAPPTAVAALFAALLTKVGIYSIYRMFTLIFYHEPQVTHLVIGILGAATMALGAFGAVAFSNIKKILTYNVIISVGLILAGLASYTTVGFTGSINYLIHDMIVKALLFLIGGAMIHLTGTDRLEDMSGLIRNHPFLGWMFFVSALSVAGIPPLSGFLGKMFITQGTFEASYYWLGGIGLATSLLVLYSVMKIFMNAFWGETLLSTESEKGSLKGKMFPIGFLTFATIALGLGVEGIQTYVLIAAESLMNPQLYIDAVLLGKEVR